MKLITIVIPVYFNEGSILPTYKVLKEKIFSNYNNLKFEVIFIEDGSKDNSYNEIVSLKTTYPTDDIKIIQFTRNFGQMAGFYAGLKNSTGDGILTIAADLQEPPELLRNLIDAFIKNEAPIIAGKRVGRDDGFFSNLYSKLFYSFMKKSAFPDMPTGGFDIAIINKDVKDMLLSLEDTKPWIQGQLFWSGYSIKFIPYERLKREIGTSKWSMSKKINHTLDAIINYTYLPLRFFSIVGIIAFVLGMLYAVLLVINYFRGNAPFNGWTPIMMLILIFGGLQMIMLGLIGEYMWRNIEQVKKKPMYVIKQIIG